MDRGVLTLTFSEPVEAQRIDPTGITFLSDVIVIVQLLLNGLNDLKIFTFLKSDANACLTISLLSLLPPSLMLLSMGTL